MVSLSAWKPGTAKQYGSGVARTPLLGCNDRRRWVVGRAVGESLGQVFRNALRRALHRCRLGLTRLQSGRRACRRLQLDRQLVVTTRCVSVGVRPCWLWSLPGYRSSHALLPRVGWCLALPHASRDCCISSVAPAGEGLSPRGLQGDGPAVGRRPHSHPAVQWVKQAGAAEQAREG